MSDEPTPIPITDNLTIPWPRLRPLGVLVSADGVKAMWDTIIAPMVADHPQSIEERTLMAVVRSVYDGMHGITHEPDDTIRPQS